MSKLSLATLAVGAFLAMVASPERAHAGMQPQGMQPQGMQPQGLSMQSLHPQDVALNSMNFYNFVRGGLPIQYMFMDGSELRGFVYDNGWQYLTGTDMFGAITTTTLRVDGQPDELQEIIIIGVETDTTENSMKTGWPGQPEYYDNDDVYLYTLLYRKYGSGNQFEYLCGGDHKGMFFAGTWDDNTHVWNSSSSQITFSCMSGVLAKCARNWGYKPWRDLPDAYGNIQNLGNLHQACTRAAKADYPGDGNSYTVTGTVIDMFDNAGYNVPATSAELSQWGFTWGVEFEAIFSDEPNGYPINDYWASYMHSSRYSEWSELSNLRGVKTVGNLSVANALYWLDGSYNQGISEIAVFRPLWPEIAYHATTDSTAESMNHFSPSCGGGSAPDRAHRWTAPSTDWYRFTTSDSSYDTVLAIYKGNSEYACNDNNAYTKNLQSSVSYYVHAGETITVVIDGKGTSSGDYYLNISRL